jgi:hypothetical protein
MTALELDSSPVNRRHFYLDEIESRVSGGLRKRLGSRAAIDRYMGIYADERLGWRGTVLASWISWTGD